MLKFLREIRQTLPPAYKYAAAGLAAMMVILALLELAALALVMPVASALAAPELLESNRWLRAFYEFAAPSSHEVFLLESVAALTLFFIVKNGLCRLGDFLSHRLVHIWPDEIVVNDILGIAIVRF